MRRKGKGREGKACARERKEKEEGEREDEKKRKEKNESIFFYSVILKKNGENLKRCYVVLKVCTGWNCGRGMW